VRYAKSACFSDSDQGGAMITVEVRLFASLRKYQPDLAIGEALIVTLDDGARLENLVDELKVPREEIKAVFVNGRWEEEDYPLRDKDRIGIFPPIGGG